MSTRLGAGHPLASRGPGRDWSQASARGITEPQARGSGLAEACGLGGVGEATVGRVEPLGFSKSCRSLGVRQRGGVGGLRR